MHSGEADLVDVNVIVDAAQTIYRAWDACRPIMSLSPDQRVASNFQDEETAAATLERSGHIDLAQQVRDRRIPIELVRAKAAGSTLSRSVSTAPPPAWLREALLSHPDGRVRDLAHAAESGALVLTTYTLSAAQAIASTRPVHHETEGVRPGKIPVADAENLVHALTYGRVLVPAPLDLSQAIQSGLLDSFLGQARQRAGEHTAALDENDPFWRVSKNTSRDVSAAKPEDMSWREYKARNPDVYGIDGDDLYMLYQVQLAAQELGRPVGLSTSDYHLAMAAAKLGIRSRLYSLENGTIQAVDVTPREFSPRRVTMHRRAESSTEQRRAPLGVGL